MDKPEVRIIRGPEVEAKTGKSRVTIWRDIKAGTFPKPVQIGRKAVGWYAHEIEAYLEALPRVGSPAKRDQSKAA